MLVTSLTSQVEMLPLKALAFLNMLPMFVTELTSQVEMFALNVDWPSNKLLMSVMPLVQLVAALDALISPTGRLVYGTPPTVPDCPSVAVAHPTVTPLASLLNDGQVPQAGLFASTQ